MDDEVGLSKNPAQVLAAIAKARGEPLDPAIVAVLTEYCDELVDAPALQKDVACPAGLLLLARRCAEWHIGDNDECGIIARTVLLQIDHVLAQADQRTISAPIPAKAL